MNIDEKDSISDWPRLLIEVEHELFEHFSCSVYERCLYYHLLAITRARDRFEIIISLRQLALALRCSEHSARKYLRSLSKKGVIEAGQTRRGFTISVKLPKDLDILEDGTDEQHIDIQELDFFTGRKYLSELLTRENWKCFYQVRRKTPSFRAGI